MVRFGSTALLTSIVLFLLVGCLQPADVRKSGYSCEGPQHCLSGFSCVNSRCIESTHALTDGDGRDASLSPDLTPDSAVAPDIDSRPDSTTSVDTNSTPDQSVADSWVADGQNDGNTVDQTPPITPDVVADQLSADLGVDTSSVDVVSNLAAGMACDFNTECASGQCKPLLNSVGHRTGKVCAIDQLHCVTVVDGKVVQTLTGECKDSSTYVACDAGNWSSEQKCPAETPYCGVNQCQFCPADSPTCPQLVLDLGSGFSLTRSTVAITDGSSTPAAVVLLENSLGADKTQLYLSFWEPNSATHSQPTFVTSGSSQVNRLAVTSGTSVPYVTIASTVSESINLRFKRIDGSVPTELGSNGFFENIDDPASDELFASLGLVTGGPHPQVVGRSRRSCVAGGFPFDCHGTIVLLDPVGKESREVHHFSHEVPLGIARFEVDLSLVGDRYAVVYRDVTGEISVRCTDMKSVSSELSVANVSHDPGFGDTGPVSDRVRTFGASGKDTFVLFARGDWLEAKRVRYLSKCTVDTIPIFVQENWLDPESDLFNGAMWSDGSFVVVYYHSVSVDVAGHLFARIYDSNGKFVSQQTINVAAQFVTGAPSVATFGSGSQRRFAVTWIGPSGNVLGRVLAP